MTLHYSGNPQTLTMEIPEIYTDYTLRVNGSVVAAKGDGTSVNIPVGDTDTHLEFTITNDAHYYSGLIYPPAIGTSQIMTRLFFVRTLVYSILCISALTLALFFHGLMDCPLKKGTLSPLWFFCAWPLQSSVLISSSGSWDYPLPCGTR